MDLYLAPGELALRLLIAAGLGAAIGIERERVEQPAGLRDHALVALGAALLMVVSQYGFAHALTARNVVLDPSRIAAQVVTGIGFIGAGTIIVRRRNVRGLTTAASIWAAAAIGLAAGGRLFIGAAIATVIALIILAGMRSFEKQLGRRAQRATIVLHAAPDFVLQDAVAAARRAGARGALRIDIAAAANEERVELVVGPPLRAAEATVLLDALRALPSVRSVESRVRFERDES